MAGYPAVIYFRNGFDEHYMIDLESFPEKLSPIASFTSEQMKGKAAEQITEVERVTGWTVIDECIYCIGGIKREKGISTVGMNLNKYNTRNPNSTWELILPNRNLRWYLPSVFASGRKIYVISSGRQLIPDYECENTDWTSYWGEYYNLDSQTWSYMPNLTHTNIKDFQNLPNLTHINIKDFQTAMDKTTIFFYSVYTGLLLLYDLREEKWIHEELHHPNMQLADGLKRDGLKRDGLERCGCREVLFGVADSVEPVVCDSTLYWFNSDMCLYGYDYVQKRWFQSNSLQGELAWHLFLKPGYLVYMPVLFYLDNETFIAICHVSFEELGMAIIGVKREPLSLNVSVKFSDIFTVEPSYYGFNPSSGMIIWKDQGSLLGKRKSASDD